MRDNWLALDAFHHLGADAARDKFAWSAQSRDRSVTVLALWVDEVVDDGVQVSVDHMGSSTLERWMNSPRNRTRTRHLKDLDAGDRVFRVVLIRAAHPDSVPRRAVRRWPDETLSMTLTSFNPVTGEFAASGKRTATVEVSRSGGRPGVFAPIRNLIA